MNDDPNDVCQCGYKRSRHDGSYRCPLGSFTRSHVLSGGAARMERYFDDEQNTHRTRLVAVDDTPDDAA